MCNAGPLMPMFRMFLCIHESLAALIVSDLAFRRMDGNYTISKSLMALWATIS